MVFHEGAGFQGEGSTTYENLASVSGLKKCGLPYLSLQSELEGVDYNEQGLGIDSTMCYLKTEHQADLASQSLNW
jgi:hypothetical protein